MFDQLNIIYPLLISVVLFLGVFVITKIVKYENALKEKNVSIIKFYLDKKFLHNSLTKSFKMPRSKNYAKYFLEDIKIYFKLNDIKVISKEELERDEELSLLFKDKLEEIINKFSSEAKKDITAICEILHEIGEKEEHRLYVYLPSNQIQKQDTKNFIYVKSSYKFGMEELETLDIYVHFAQLLKANVEYTR